MERYVVPLSEEFNLKKEHAANIIKLLEEGNTIPFIARYRKELTGSVDDQTLRAFSERYAYLQNLDQRRNEIYKLIDEQGKMTEEIKQAIESAAVLAELEDIYRPYRPKRRTRATVAKEKGLEPLAEAIYAQEANDADPAGLAAAFIDAEKGVETVEDALNGAKDIIAEWISDNASVRKAIREYTMKYGRIESVAAKEEDSVYSTYYEFSSPVDRVQSHQILAINRGEREGFLKVAIRADESVTKNLMYRRTLKGEGTLTGLVREAVDDAYARLIFPSIEREVRNSLT